MTSNPRKFRAGFTLIETLISVGIFVIIVSFIGIFQKDIFSLNSYIQSDLNSQIEGRRAVVKMVKEMRTMSPSSLGAYPIAQAATSSITFYTNVDNDALKEQVRYYIQSGKVLRSVIKPTGNPLVYNSGSAVTTTVVSSVGNGTSTPLFEYYDSGYYGTTSPISIPVDVASVKLVKISVALNRQSSKSNLPLLLTSQVTIRNLKDNL